MRCSGSYENLNLRCAVNSSTEGSQLIDLTEKICGKQVSLLYQCGILQLIASNVVLVFTIVCEEVVRLNA